jgi:protein SCO1
VTLVPGVHRPRLRGFFRSVAVLALLLAANASFAQPKPAPGITDLSVPKELTGIEIDDKPGAKIPTDIRARDSQGREVRISDYFDGEHPVILALAYYECPMLCTLVLNGLLDGLKGTDLTAGKDFRVVVISIDPRDTPEMAHKKRETYVKSYGREIADRGWDFLVADQADVKRIADTIGFKYRWDEPTKQFAHAAGIFVASPNATLSRTLYGLAFPSKDVKLALLEATEGKIGSTLNRVLLFCFHYSVAENRYVLATRRLMKAGGILTVIGLAGLLARYWRAERRRQAKPVDGAVA